jgi:hypothetical protein
MQGSLKSCTGASGATIRGLEDPEKTAKGRQEPKVFAMGLADPMKTQLQVTQVTQDYKLVTQSL